MPFDNKRNSRDDKSKKPFRSSKSDSDSSPNQPRSRSTNDASTNDDKKKLFASDKKRPYGTGFKKDFDKSSGGRSEGPSERKTFNKTEGSKFGKLAGSRSEVPSERKPFNKSEGSKFSKPERSRSEGSPERKSFGKSEGSKFGKPERQFEPKGNTKNPEIRFNVEGLELKDERSPRYGKADTGKPYKKEFKSRSASTDRKRTPGERSKNTTSKAKKAADDGLIRLNRYISNAGICSRRKADELIQAGVVTVNGEPVNELGAKVNPMKDVIRYNGETLKREKMVYVLLNKPKDYITTTDDPQERRTVMQLVEKASKERIYPVGRLDRNTTGLLLMTNDGDLTDKLSHPKNNVVKIYNVELNRSLSQGDLNKIAYGLELEDGIIKPDEVSYVQGGSKREVGIQIHSGKNRVVRRIFEHLGYEVVKLDRVVYANLTKKDLARGRWRYLEEKEVIQLKHLIK